MQENAHPGILNPGNSRFITAALITGAAVFATDQWLKTILFAKESLMSMSWIGGLIRFTNHQNYGISFNIPVPWFLMIIIAVSAILWCVYQLFKTRHSLITSIFLGIFIGGILGNLMDRITLNFVRDWLLLWGHSAVNFADGAILIGLIGFWFTKKIEKPVPVA